MSFFQLFQQSSSFTLFNWSSSTLSNCCLRFPFNFRLLFPCSTVVFLYLFPLSTPFTFSNCRFPLPFPTVVIHYLVHCRLPLPFTIVVFLYIKSLLSSSLTLFHLSPSFTFSHCRLLLPCPIAVFLSLVILSHSSTFSQCRRPLPCVDVIFLFLVLMWSFLPFSTVVQHYFVPHSHSFHCFTVVFFPLLQLLSNCCLLLPFSIVVFFHLFQLSSSFTLFHCCLPLH